MKRMSKRFGIFTVTFIVNSFISCGHDRAVESPIEIQFAAMCTAQLGQ